MKNQTRRFLAMLLSIVMVAALFVPTFAAVPMMDGDEVEIDEAVIVDEVGSDVEVLADTKYTLNAKDSTHDSYFTVGSGMSTGKTSQTIDGTEYSTCWDSGGKSGTGSPGRYISFTTEGAAVVKVWWNKNAPVIATVADTDKGTVADSDSAANIAKFTISAGGTYYLNFTGQTRVYVVEVTEEGPSHEHEWDAGKVTTPATCTAKGVKTYNCTVSGCTKTKTEDVDMIAHTPADVAAVAATCDKDGTTAGKKCSVCETVLEGCEPVPAAHVDADNNGVCDICGKCDHKWSLTGTTPASCTVAGVKNYKCDNCAETKTEPIAATGHDWKADGTCANGCGETKNTSFMTAEGDLETAYALWPIDSAVSKYEAYIIDSSNKETKVDDYLIRQYPGYMRVDVLGLKAGSYKIKVKDNKGGEMTTGTLSVKAHERTGYAFEGGNIPGAYKMDGTLKDGARVLYITDENKDAVKLSVLTGKNEEERTGLMDIIGAYSKKKESRPLVIRFVGMINPPSGLDKGACYVQGGNSITFEGVGNDATMKGWGFLIKDSTNVEVRNVGFVNSAGGDGDCVSIEQRNNHIWLHNCDFFYATAGSDSDQSKGDGSLDVKETTYGTFSYNHFWDCGKTSLVGMKDNVDYLTYHHNWFDHSDSRHPRVRFSQHIHIYNNYFDGVCKYGPGSSEGASLFVEANYFRNTRFPMISGMMAHDIKTNGEGILSNELGGVIKAYGNVIVGAEGFTSYQENPNDFDAYVATTRGEVIPSTVKAKGGTYSNFDTKSDFYKYTPESAEDAMVTTTKWAGRVQGGDFQWEFDNATQDYPAGEASAAAVIPELKAAVVGYTGKMVKVGGTLGSSATVEEHKHTPGAWLVTTSPTCTVDGEETQYCAICNDPINTRKVPAAHSNDGQGKCAVCGETIANSGGAANSASSGGKMLKHDQFIMTAPLTDNGKKSEFAENEVEDATEGYFHVIGKVVKRNGNGGADAGIVGTKAEFFELPKSNTSGFSFTVTYVPAKVTVAWGTPKDSQKATLAIVKDGTALSTETKGGKSFSTTLDLTTAGTYLVTSAENSEYGARVFSITVTETEPPCEHDGTTTHHPAVAVTCTKDGSEEYWTCNSCKKNFADEACTKPITDITIESNGHDWSDWVVSADGKTQTRTCSVCNETETEDVSGGDEPDDPPASVDTKGLEAAIAAAEKLTAVKVDTDAANVDEGVSWVTQSVMDALKGAIATAKGLDTTKADQAAVDKAADTLNKAVNTFVDAVQEGSKKGGGTSTGSVHTFESKTLTKADAGSAASGAYAGDSYFTLVPGSKTKYDESSKQWTAESFGDNAYDPSGDGAQSKVIRFNMVAATTKDGPGIKFTTATDNAKVQIWWVQGGGDTEQKDDAGNKNGEFKDAGIRQIAVVKASDASKVAASELAHTSSTPSGTDAGRIKANDPEYTELTIPTAGEYMVGSLDGSNYIFKIVVTEGASGSTTPTVDKSALTKAIEDATAAIAVPTVSKDGKDVETDKKWVTQAVKDTFQAAITAAKAAKLTAESEADVADAVKTLTDAQTAFVAAQKAGTKDEGTTPKPGPNPGPSPSHSSSGGSSTPVTPPKTLPFVDVAENAWYHDTVAKAYEKGLMKGTDDTHFAPNQNTSRAMIATILYRLDGEKKTNVKAAFDDVAAGTWYTEAVAWAAKAGVVKGRSENIFAPNSDITREELAVMLYRYAKATAPKGTAKVDAFADGASVSNWAIEAMEWCVEKGIITGKGANNLDPHGLATRAEAVTMIMRFVDLGK